MPLHPYVNYAVIHIANPTERHISDRALILVDVQGYMTGMQTPC